VHAWGHPGLQHRDGMCTTTPAGIWTCLLCKMHGVPHVVNTFKGSLVSQLHLLTVCVLPACVWPCCIQPDTDQRLHLAGMGMPDSHGGVVYWVSSCAHECIHSSHLVARSLLNCACFKFCN
jgi:hypothetical protein